MKLKDIIENYKRNLLESHGIFSGYNGKSFLDAGYVYFPYIPLVITQSWPKIEISNDLCAFHDDASNELVKEMSNRIAMDIDEQILNSIVKENAFVISQVADDFL